MGSLVSHVLERALGLSAWLCVPSTTSSALWRSFLATTVCQRPSQKPSPAGACSAVILPAPLSTWNNSCQRKQEKWISEFIHFFWSLRLSLPGQDDWILLDVMYLAIDNLYPQSISGLVTDGNDHATGSAGSELECYGHVQTHSVGRSWKRGKDWKENDFYFLVWLFLNRI